MDVDALRAVQTSGPTTPSTCLLRSGPFWQKIRKKKRILQNKTNRDGTLMKINGATKNETNELKY